ncbi:ABC transporter substrate-binding protein [Mucilaginibacter ginkgonis]|uniref:Amino acid ABC transporter substrate-binding protein n=1 Tax=Mucilaginibacter ginkgonis TaxID=2682091 RepID=A0A6I4IMM7_9SPHI|nr:ABC transporter substrate-binding protein [Mucilaginibacter ginkgonis]QQL50039.1 amino acid ABC transporter substrate-binding protein [Mucilaginibacter ginkgonis]
MTSVLNRLLQLSGNKLWLIAAVAAFASCSPKVRPVVQHPAPEAPMPVEKSKPVVAKPATPRFSTIAIIMPFNLDNLNPAVGYSKTALKQANMGISYYQGFKLALDSLTADGYNFRIQLLDGKDNAGTASALASNSKVRNADLVVGPIFPEGIKAFGTASMKRKLMLSPLSPVSPATFNNPNLITATPPLDYHAKRMAGYAVNTLKAKKVFVLKSGYSEDNKYIIPFKEAVDSLSKLRVKVIPFVVTRGNLTSLLPQLSKTETNVFLLPSLNQAFLQVTLRSLDSLSKNYPVALIGHPSWEGFTFLRAEMLQRLKTVISSSEHINYKSGETVQFIRAYRKAYHNEPDAYAIRGFDEGMYFGDLLAGSHGNPINAAERDYDGLSNHFHFVRKPGLGWINTHVFVLRYTNYELRVVE